MVLQANSTETYYSRSRSFQSYTNDSKTHTKEPLQLILYEASPTLMPKPDKYTMRKENYKLFHTWTNINVP